MIKMIIPQTLNPNLVAKEPGADEHKHQATHKDQVVGAPWIELRQTPKPYTPNSKP